MNREEEMSKRRVAERISLGEHAHPDKLFLSFKSMMLLTTVQCISSIFEGKENTEGVTLVHCHFLN